MKLAHNKSNMYGLIAGFVEVGETLEEACNERLFEEVGLKLKIFIICRAKPWPFPSNLMIVFMLNMIQVIFNYLEEISEAQFFKFDQLPEIPFKGQYCTCNDYAKIEVENKSILIKMLFI